MIRSSFIFLISFFSLSAFAGVYVGEGNQNAVTLFDGNERPGASSGDASYKFALEFDGAKIRLKGYFFKVFDTFGSSTFSNPLTYEFRIEDKNIFLEDQLVGKVTQQGMSFRVHAEQEGIFLEDSFALWFKADSNEPSYLIFSRLVQGPGFSNYRTVTGKLNQQ